MAARANLGGKVPGQVRRTFTRYSIAAVVAVLALVAACTTLIPGQSIAFAKSLWHALRDLRSTYFQSRPEPPPAITLRAPTFPLTAPVYPLKLSSNKRYLMDQNNVPFLLVGDSPQSLISNLSEADANSYLADRQTAGFNAVWVNLLCKTYTGCRSDGTTFDGIQPFTIPEDLSTRNDAYFTRADHMIQLAALHGIVVFLDPIETGGWLGTLQSNGLTKAFDYGVYLGNRYKNQPNIVWMSGNDFDNHIVESDDALVRAVVTGIRSVDASHIHTVEFGGIPPSTSLDDADWSSLVELNTAYTYNPTYSMVLHGYGQSPTMPVFLVEEHYEGENVGGEMGTPNVLRRQEYWTLLSGATGQLYGSLYWNLHSGWKTGIDTVGVQQLQYVTALFAPRPWYNLVPDQTHTVITAGYGAFSNSGNVSANDYLTAARTPDGGLVVAYMPTRRTITVDMTKLSGPATAEWYDPANGTYTPISGSPFTNTGTHQFMPPGNNSAGDGDWVLILQTNPILTPSHWCYLPLIQKTY